MMEWPVSGYIFDYVWMCSGGNTDNMHLHMIQLISNFSWASACKKKSAQKLAESIPSWRGKEEMELKEGKPWLPGMTLIFS